MLALEALPHLNRNTFPSQAIDHGEGSKPLPIHQLIGHKVQGPGIIRSRHRWPMNSDFHGFPPLLWPMMLLRQAFFPVETIHKLPHGSVISIKEHPNIAVDVPHPCPGQLVDLLLKRRA